MSEPTGAGSPSKVLRTTKETHPNLPPGLVINPDGSICKVCNTWRDFAKTKVKKVGGTGSGSSSGGGDGSEKRKTGAMGGMGGFAAMMSGAGAATSSKTTTNQSTEPESTDYSTSSPQTLDRKDCPADTTLLGRSTWTFLHTTAAYYPLQAPEQTQRNMINLLSSLSFLYPCIPCAEDFQEKVKENPPDVTGREALSRWLCERHNEVNEKLGKERFSCDWSSLNTRWKDGPSDSSCD